MTTAPEAVLQGRAISMRFGGNHALRDVDVTLTRGARVGLIGPNGSGKTTLLNVLSGVYRATSGSIELNGRNIIGMKPSARARQGIVRTFQHPQLAESLTLLENVVAGEQLGRRNLGSDKSQKIGHVSWELLELLGCAEYAHLLPSRAPYGAAKLAEVARAAAAAPPVLLLDEPAAGLSTEERGELVNALRRVGEYTPHMALCLVEHDVPLVSSICDELLVLNAGQLLDSGPSEKVLKNPLVRDAYLGHARTSETPKAEAEPEIVEGG